MKRSILIALILAMGASFFSADATPRKKKQKAQKAMNKPVRLTTATDSISYASGVAMSKDLMTFIRKNFRVEADKLPIVMEAFEEALRLGSNDSLRAVEAGYSVANVLSSRMLPGLEKEMGDEVSHDLFYRGFRDGVADDSTHFSVDSATTFFQHARQQHKKLMAQRNLTEGERFLDENAKKEGVKVTGSGLQYKVLKEGNGLVANSTDDVVVRYEGRLIDGTVFDSSYRRKPDTSRFAPKQLIKGWGEALTMMPEGSKWELYIPQQLAYGEHGTAQVPPCSALVFTVEVVRVERKNVMNQPLPGAIPLKKTPNLRKKKK